MKNNTYGIILIVKLNIPKVFFLIFKLLIASTNDDIIKGPGNIKSKIRARPPTLVSNMSFIIYNNNNKRIIAKTNDIIEYFLHFL